MDKLDGAIQDRIETGLKKLASTPVPHNAKFIYRDEDNDKVFRHRIGDYRALYIVDDVKQVVIVTKIDKRPRIYG